jgi:integrase
VIGDGLDPLAESEAIEIATTAINARATTFAQAAASFLKQHRDGWKNPKHQQQWENTLQSYALPVIGDLPLNNISVEHILKILAPIWTMKNETASRLRGRIEKILDFGKVMGWREGENVARWRGNLDHLLPARARVRNAGNHAAMPWADVPQFWVRLGAADGLGAKAIAFAVLTAARTGEVLGARWQEIDWQNQLWTIPKDRMKMRVEHRVPLSRASMRLLQQLQTIRQTEDGYLFPGNKPNQPLSDMVMLMTLKRMKIDATVHGFRSAFRTWAAEKTEFDHHVCEAALAHRLKDKVERAYTRGDYLDKRRGLMEDWADFVTGL